MTLIIYPTVGSAARRDLVISEGVLAPLVAMMMTAQIEHRKQGKLKSRIAGFCRSLFDKELPALQPTAFALCLPAFATALRGRIVMVSPWC